MICKSSLSGVQTHMANTSITSSQGHSAVHWAIKLTAKAGKEAELESALERFVQRSLGEHGAVGVHLFRSTTETGGRDFFLHRSFLSKEHSRQFYESEMYRQYQAETDDLIEGDAVIRPLYGFEAFFHRGSGTPPRWKMAIVTWLGVFPAVLFWSWLLSTHLSRLHPVAVTAVVTILVVVSLTWAIMPRLHGVLRPWLNTAVDDACLRVPQH